MSFFINYQRVLKRIEDKARARSKKPSLRPSDVIFLMDGGNLRVYTPETVYLESMKVDKKLCN
ncbi:hypothetical protein ACFL5G_04810 [Candidatus Margulisiibacteriota bacterium]